MMATAKAPSAPAVLKGLIGQTIRTVTGAPNTVLEVTDSHVLVATERTARALWRTMAFSNAIPLSSTATITDEVAPGWMSQARSMSIARMFHCRP